MPRLPDEMSLGERRVGDGRAPIVIDRSGEIAVEGLSQAAGNLNAAVQRYAQHDDTYNFGRARSALQQKDVELRSQLAEDPNWETHEQRYSEGMKTAREEAAKLIRGSRSRAMFENDATVDVTRGTAQIRGQAKEIEGHWGRSTLDDTLNTNRTAALEAKDIPTRDALIQSTQDSIAGALQKRYITPEQAKNLQQTWTASYGEGFVEVEPSIHQQLKLLKNPKGTPADFIAPDKRQNMIKVLENQLRVQSDQREAKAERALAQWERQISSGIPTTPKLRKEWSSLIAGTSVQGELDNLLAGEQEVQETLRKPIGEQIRLVQEKDAALKKNGGTMAEAANVQRLTQAVKQNVALLQNDPLLFAEQRLDTPNTPIDVAGITVPGQQAEIASVLHERAAQLDTVSKHFGTPVPMKPFLPQEAAQMSTILEKASPAEASDIFAGLRMASPDMRVFKGAIQQIAPDAPVKAMAGILAAQERELVTATHWFRPDTTVTSKNVAETMLEGERLMNPSKGDKADDGKPKSKALLLPTEAQTQLQARFADEVGDTFAGRPDAMNNALQAVQAYYIGKASKQGTIAADSKSVDSRLVKEAVRATLGSVVDYNDNGSVLAPWGMSANDFEDRVETAFEQQKKALGISKDITPELSTFGLANGRGEGQYVVTLGRNWLIDANGVPVTIDLKPREAADKRGFIAR